MKSGGEPDDLAGAALIADLERFKPDGISLNGWAVGAGVNRAVWGDIRRHGNPSRRTLEKLLGFAGSSLAEFEALRVGEIPVPIDSTRQAVDDHSQGWRTPRPRKIPCLSVAVGIPYRTSRAAMPTFTFSGSVEGQVDCPMSLATAPGLYAFRIPGDSMWPRYRPGRILLVAPSMKAAAGDDVLLWVRSGQGSSHRTAMIAELSSRADGQIRIRQFNPDLTIAIAEREIEEVQRVVGEIL